MYCIVNYNECPIAIAVVDLFYIIKKIKNKNIFCDDISRSSNDRVILNDFGISLYIRK